MAGRSCGGGASQMGTGFSWGAPEPPSTSISGRGRATTAQSSASRVVDHAPAAPGSSAADFAPGAVVAYTMKPGADEQEATVLEVVSSQGRRDNILIQFQDGRERNTSEGKLRLLRPAQQQQQQQQPPLDGTRHNSMAPVASPLKQQASPHAAPQAAAPHEIQNIPPSPERHAGGFGDTGRSSIRLHSSAGGQNSMGSSFGWGDADASPKVTHCARAGGNGQQAQHQAHHDHQQPQQHQPSPLGGGGALAHAPQPSSPFRKKEFEEHRIGSFAASPPSAPRSPAQQQQGGSPLGKGEFQENKIGSQVGLTVVKGSSAGELALGQSILYRQSPNSDEVLCTVVDIELPSTNGAMRTKTFYKVQFEDGRTRQTTRDKLSVPR